MDNQKAKADAGKPKLTLVPRQIIYDIAEVREYGNKKYGNSENWKTVEIERYRDAAFRHFMAYLDNPQGVDEESGIEHLKHLATNIAFLCEMEEAERKRIKEILEERCQTNNATCTSYQAKDYCGGVSLVN